MNLKPGRFCDIAISGAGVPGLALALGLVEQGWRVALFDSGSMPQDHQDSAAEEARSVAVMQKGLALLERLGVLARLKTEAGVLSALRIEHGARGATFYPESEREQLFGLNLAVWRMRRALWTAVRESPRLDTFWQDPVTCVEQGRNGVNVTLTSGTIVGASLLIGADGKNSRVREASGIPVRRRLSGQKALTALIEHEFAHENVSIERHKKGGPFTTVPLAAPNQSSLVWLEQRDRHSALAGGGLSLQKKAAEALMPTALGELRALHGVAFWEIEFLNAARLATHRTLVMAEAAHAFSPIGAKGMNLSLDDVDVLLRIMKDAAGSGVDPGHAEFLRRYELQRMPQILKESGKVGFLNQYVQAGGIFQDVISGSGLQLLNGFPALKNGAIRIMR